MTHRAPTLPLRRRRLSRLTIDAPRQIADGVWLVRGGLPRRSFNVFLLQAADGAVMFDSGSREMGPALARLLGSGQRLREVVLSHAHADHRGGARAIGAPVACHPLEVQDVEGDAGRHRWLAGGAGLNRDLWRGRIMSTLRDGGPARVSRTLTEHDPLEGGFQVIELPGHTAGQIGLWRPSDRLVLAADCFYMAGHPAAPTLPKGAFNSDSARARESLRKLADLDPRTAWPAHGPALTGDVKAALERAAAA